MYILFFEYVDFWANIYLILYPSLGNSTTHITIQQAAFVSNLEDHEDDLDDLVKTVEKLTKMTNVLFYLVCGLGAVTLMFFAVFIYTRCSNTRPQSGY